MKKYLSLLCIGLFSFAIFSPAFAQSVNSSTSVNATTLQLIQVLTQLLHQLEAQLQTLLAQQANNTNINMSGGNCPSGQTWSGLNGGCISQTQNQTSLPNITITRPGSGVMWDRNQLGSWTWTSSGNISLVDVYLQIGSTYYPFASSYPNSGNFSWAVGLVPSGWRGVSNIPNGIYTIAVCPAGSYVSTAQCGEFNVDIGGTVPSINILSPQGGENFQIGGMINVSFSNPQAGDTYQFNLLQSAKVSPIVYTLGTARAVGTGSQQTNSFSIPSNLSAGTYTVQVIQLTNNGSSCVNTCAQDESNPFSLNTQQITYAPNIESVGSPANPVNSFYPGDNVTIVGSNFPQNPTIMIGTTAVTGLTNASGMNITFTAPTLSTGTYDLYLSVRGGSNTVRVTVLSR